MPNPNNSAVAVAAPVEMTLCGNPYKVGVLKMKSVGRIQAEINKLPAPEAARKIRPICEGLPREVVQSLISDAVAEDKAWPPELIFDFRANKQLTLHEEIRKLFVYEVLSSYNPGVTAAAAGDIADGMNAAEFAVFYKTAMSVDDLLSAGDDSGPKDPASPPVPSTS